jgi:hypothetical protein
MEGIVEVCAKGLKPTILIRKYKHKLGGMGAREAGRGAGRDYLVVEVCWFVYL